MDDNKSVRCKACDTLFSTVWIEERGEHEELCWRCLTAAFTEGLDDDDTLPARIAEAYEEWVSTSDEIS